MRVGLLKRFISIYILVKLLEKPNRVGVEYLISVGVCQYSDKGEVFQATPSTA